MFRASKSGDIVWRDKVIWGTTVQRSQTDLLNLWQLQNLHRNKKPPSGLPALQRMLFHFYDKVSSKWCNSYKYKQWNCDASPRLWPLTNLLPLWSRWLTSCVLYCSSTLADRSWVIKQEELWCENRPGAASETALPWTWTCSLSSWEHWSALVRHKDTSGDSE